MLLQRLKPREGADLGQLRTLLEGHGWRAAVPAALPEKVLLALARDFRSVECSISGEDEGEPRMAAPMYVVLNLLMNHPARKATQGADLQLSDASMIEAMQAYQWALEREIVSRIVGLGGSQNSDSLMMAIENAASEA